MTQPQGITWDLSGYFPSFDGPEMQAFKKQLAGDTAKLQKEAAALAPLSSETANDWEKVVLALESISARTNHLSSYIECLGAADTANEEYAAQAAAISALYAEKNKIGVDLDRAFKNSDLTIFTSFVARPSLKPIAYALSRIRMSAQNTMTPTEEKLAAELAVDGFAAWDRLYEKISGKLSFTMRWPDGKTETLPISRWRALMSSADRAVGKAAFEGGNKAWEGMEDACAAALNALSGTRLTLYRKRHLQDFLARPLFNAGISRKTLEAMYSAIHANLDFARSLVRARAGAMGRDSLAFYEREAPLPLDSSSGKFSWEEGRDKVSTAFGALYPDMRDYFHYALEKRWVESQSRGGKRPGAFCTGSDITAEQRVYMTYNGTLGDIGTLAHETGHAWHGHLLRAMRPWACDYPMTLAETASVFAEHVLSDGLQSDPQITGTQKLMLLDDYIGGASVMLLDITVRFEFEKAFHEERLNGELSAARLKELMAQTQRNIYGDALSPGGEDPMFWASKLHFYKTDVAFYNFPYTFGFLLARTLFARLKKEGPAFLPKYEKFLRMAASATAENIAADILDADLEKPDFWAGAIHSLSLPLDQYKTLLAKGTDGKCKKK
jgi:oligoendopeptidase F